MLNDFEIPWHEFFRRYWWGGTAGAEYTNSGVYRSCAAGGSAKGPSSRLTVAPQNGVGHKKRRFRGQLAKKSSVGHKKVLSWPTEV